MIETEASGYSWVRIVPRVSRKTHNVIDGCYG